jgi:hypothetical protein
MKKMTLLSKVGCVVAAAGGLLAGCGTEPVTESDAQPVSEVRQAVARGLRFNAVSESELDPSTPQADQQVWRRSDNTWHMRRVRMSLVLSYPLDGTAAEEDVPVQGNYDGDYLYDAAIYRPSVAQFRVRRSSTGQQYTFAFGTGMAGAFPAVGDFDGDGLTDHAVWRDGSFVVLRSTDYQYSYFTLGQYGDIPVIGNYDGDTKDDFAVWRPSNGTWYYHLSSTGVFAQFQYGMAGDIPLSADFDGDRKTDIAVFRPTNGTWYIINSGTGTGTQVGSGGLGDYPTPADHDGNGKADIYFWRPSDGGHYKHGDYGTLRIGSLGQAGDLPTNTNVYCRKNGLIRPCNSNNSAAPGN